MLGMGEARTNEPGMINAIPVDISYASAQVRRHLAGLFMRIEFSNSTRTMFRWNQPLLRIGSDSDNDLVLAAGQVAPHHLCISLDRRGWVLDMLPDATRIYVNARPVRERAILRPGDMLSVAIAACSFVGTKTPLDARRPRCLSRSVAQWRCVPSPGRFQGKCCRWLIGWSWGRRGERLWICRKAKTPR